MTDLPGHELNAFLMTITDAVDLVHDGRRAEPTGRMPASEGAGIPGGQSSVVTT